MMTLTDVLCPVHATLHEILTPATPTLLHQEDCRPETPTLLRTMLTLVILMMIRTPGSRCPAEPQRGDPIQQILIMMTQCQGGLLLTLMRDLTQLKQILTQIPRTHMLLDYHTNDLISNDFTVCQCQGF